MTTSTRQPPRSHAAQKDDAFEAWKTRQIAIERNELPASGRELDARRGRVILLAALAWFFLMQFAFTFFAFAVGDVFYVETWWGIGAQAAAIIAIYFGVRWVKWVFTILQMLSLILGVPAMFRLVSGLSAVFSWRTLIVISLLAMTALTAVALLQLMNVASSPTLHWLSRKALT